MADVNDLDNIAEPDPVDWANYTEGGGSGKGKVAPKGEYLLVATETPIKGKTQREQKLQFELRGLKVQGGEFDGLQIFYTRFNTQKWPGKESNGLADYLRGHGMPGPFTTNAEYEQATLRTVGRPFKAGLDWEGQCRQRKGEQGGTACGTRVKNEENFPLVGGQRQQWVECPNGCKTAEGKPRRIFANNVVKYVVSTVKK